MKRYYFAITNACNRACELCSCYSNPKQKVFLPLEKFISIVSGDEVYEVQLEGGEPLLHPEFNAMLEYCCNDNNCIKVTIGTNGTNLDYAYENNKLDYNKSINNIISYFLRFNKPITLKPSINYYLIEEDPLHLEKCEIIKKAFEILKSRNDNYELIFNVRKRKKPEDSWIEENLRERQLYNCSNIFFYQRYGYAKNNFELEEPFVIENPVDFHLISPDGKDFGKDLMARSSWMGELEIV